MSQNYFPKVEQWCIPKVAISKSLRELARDGVCGNEGIVLWLGRRNNGVAQITHIVTLQGTGVTKQPNFLKIETALFDEVSDKALRLNVTLIGHIHSHGPYCGIDLSSTDEKLGIAVPYFLSVVVPSYGLLKNTQIGDCGIHVFDPRCGFQRLSLSEVNRCIHIQQFHQCPQIILDRSRV